VRKSIFLPSLNVSIIAFKLKSSPQNQSEDEILRLIRLLKNLHDSNLDKDQKNILRTKLTALTKKIGLEKLQNPGETREKVTKMFQSLKTNDADDDWWWSDLKQWFSSVVHGVTEKIQDIWQTVMDGLGFSKGFVENIVFT